MGSAAVAVGTLVVTLLAVPPPAHAAPQPWSGYRITRTGTADGGFVGARKAGRVISYRIDPDARRAAWRYHPARRVARVPRRDVSARQVARAAWVLSKYGAVRVPAQSAAVDLTTYALLAGRGLDHPRARARLRQTGQGAAIRGLAETMLSQSRRFAGPYRVRLTATGADVGDQVSARVAVRSRTGVPVPRLSVRVTLRGRPSQVVRTDAQGVARASFLATSPGFRTVRAVVRRVPESRLLLRVPRQRGAPRIAVAGRKTRLQRRTVVAVRGRPTVHLAAPREVVDGRKPFGLGFTVAGGAPSGRTASVTLHGPFADPASATCSAAAVTRSTARISGNGTYPATGGPVAHGGFYVWAVTVPGDAVNHPAYACGAAVRARTRPTVQLSTLSPSSGVRAKIQVGGLRPGYDDVVTFRLYGPYPDRSRATCNDGKLVRRSKVRVTGDGTYRSDVLAVTRPGVYAWQAVLPAAPFTFRVVTACGAAGTTVRVR